MKFKIKIGAGIVVFAFFLLIGGSRYIQADTLIPWFMAVFTHELGHLAVAFICGAKIKSMTFDVFGARIALSGELLSYNKEIAIAAAGPGVNFILGGILFEVFPNFSQFSFLLGFLNLMPIITFDGYRILYSFASLHISPERIDRCMRFISVCAVITIWFFSVYMLLRYKASFSLFLLSFAMLVRLCA